MSINSTVDRYEMPSDAGVGFDLMRASLVHGVPKEYASNERCVGILRTKGGVVIRVVQLPEFKG